MKITFINMFKKNHKPKHSEKEDVKIKNKIISKNQVALLSIALMLISASYMNQANSFRQGDLGDAKLVSTEITEQNEVEEKHNEDESVEKNIDSKVNNELVETANLKTDDYYTKTRLDREKMYSQMLETYTKILEDEKIPNDQKIIASNEIKNINDRKNQISIIENICKTKDFKDVVVLMNDNSTNVVVKQDEELTEEQVAKLLNIVSREMNMNIENIHISKN